MKAVIMAGGKGTRLKPLTCHLPKPMVPLLDRPCMEYIIDLLKQHGITEIALTVQYLPQLIRNHFGDGSEYGVHLHYFEEITPLGTAGSVKNAEKFLDETFLVISGDALTDFNLSEAIAFHQEKQAIGTLVLTQVEVPLEYGVVMTQEDGRIIRFLEKPSWGEVFSDTVNTGIYVLEPEILQFFDAGKEFDFSKDLFPLVMKNNLPLYGYVAEGYWSDIGNLDQYRQSQFDMINGLVNVRIKGTELMPKVWVGEGVTIHQGVDIQAPVFIGDGTKIKAEAKIAPYTVLGRYNCVEQGANLERSVIWNRSLIGKSACITGATLCNDVKIGAGASVNEDAVIGEKSWIGEQALIKTGVKIWPEKNVSASKIQQSSLIWGKASIRSLFGEDGIRGVPNLELTPEIVGKIAAAFVSCLSREAIVTVSSDEFPYSEIFKYAMISSLLAVGVKVRDIGSTSVPVARYACRSSYSDGGIHIGQTGGKDEQQVVIQFFDRHGLPIDKSFERKIENAFLQEDFARPVIHELNLLQKTANIGEQYVQEILSRVDGESIRKHQLKIVFHSAGSQVTSVLQQILDRLGCRAVGVFNGEAELPDIVVDNKADVGIALESSGQKFSLITEKGYLLSDEELLVLQTQAILREQRLVAIPVTAPSIVEKIAHSAGVSVVRTKAATRSLLEVNNVNPLQVHYDGFYSLVAILNLIVQRQTTLQTLLETFPQLHMHTEWVTCPIEEKGRVMRRLMTEMKGQQLELIDGIKVLNDEGWALILPDAEKAFFKVVAEGNSRSQATELTELYKEKIRSYQSHGGIDFVS